MPFTAAHPAIVIPTLKSKWTSASAIIIGSICPDFEYFLRTEIKSTISHTIEGLLLFNLPVGLLIWLLFHLIVKKPLLYSFPGYFRVRLTELFHYKIVESRNLYIVPICLVIGSASHIIWDSFTHYNGYFVGLFGLNFPISFGNVEIAFYRIIQHGSTFVGIAIICLYFHKLGKVDSIEYRKSSYWLIVAVIAIGFIAGKFLLSDPITIGEIVVSVISALLLGIVTASIFTHRVKIQEI